MTRRPRQRPDLVAFSEDVLARAGFAVVSAETYALFESIERRLAIGVEVPSADFEAFYAYLDHTATITDPRSSHEDRLGGVGPSNLYNRWGPNRRQRRTSKSAAPV